ncbi:hypothetical protein F441_22125 [Phytophthora nicotianae CJ01A1]|uniref:Ubiquitin-like protease family profile domain-containing protein n=4 Tax=Phytophthora nicotianae TaxID=4792 RepID=W2VS05_PHYNI|nr:hypothetical protein L916_17874 [Phytophthora nicotianae]ETO59415.1 hypothetical protein F444_22217 [Phytophthora nicotianae P1976]ETP00453.1 hypothetical protein F441_22125 [Phytophthora nicotianae CJ01A1]
MVEAVDVLRKAGAKKKSILQFLLANSDCSMTIRDVHNPIHRLKRQEHAGATSLLTEKFLPMMTLCRLCFIGAFTEQVLIPVYCNQNHWCAITINLEKRIIYFYDPTESLYKIGARAAAEKIKNLLRVQLFEGCCVQSYGSNLGVQTDNYKCGIHVLVVYRRSFTGAD